MTCLELGLSLWGGNLNNALVEKQAVREVMSLGKFTAKYGLALTEAQAMALVETRSTSLKATGRIEFGGGIVGKIILEFCDSPYLVMGNYEEVLHDLIAAFYYYKNETLDLMTDDELIKYMKKAFDGVCQGSVDLLIGRELDSLARNLRYGRTADFEEENLDEDEDENGEH